MQGPHRIIDGLPAGGALGRAGLLGRRGGRGWHRDRARPIGQRHGLLAPRGIDGVEGLAMRGEHLGEDFGEVLQQMKTVCDLGGRGGALTCALGIGTRPIPG